jgi:hypothetical protein
MLMSRIGVARARRRIIGGMATSSKRTAPTRHKPAAVPSPSTLDAAHRPFLRFYHSVALRDKTLELLTAMEQAPDAAAYRERFADLVVELTHCGLDAFYMAPLKRTEPGFVIEQSAHLGMAGVQQVMAPVVRQIVGHMNGPQLLSACASLRSFML